MSDTAPNAGVQANDDASPADGAGKLQPQVYVISGPTAVGKGTIVARLRRLHPEIFVSCSATTRAPRPGETDGLSYYFISNEEFDRLTASGGLLEWASVHGDRYGTPREPVEKALEQGRPVILEIDLQGARQVRTSYPQAVVIFLAPPSWDELVHRLQGRGTETRAQQDRRLVTARDELAAEDEFDHVVVNEDIEATVRKMVDLMRL